MTAATLYRLSLYLLAGANALAASTDNAVHNLPEDWFPRDSTISGSLHAVVYAGGQFVAAGDGIATSPDGITWTVRQIGLPAPVLDLAYGNGQLVAVGGRSPAYLGDSENALIMTSPDGVAW